jgi:hypothetical protein
MSIGLWWVIHPMMPLTIPQTAVYPTACDSALGCILTLSANNLHDIYMDYKDHTELWDALECKYAVSEDGRLLYISEQLFNFSIDAVKSIVMQAHKFHLLAREIACLGCPIPDRVVAMAIIVKLPTSWRDFATSLKHKREDISTESLITALDVEEKARVKDAPSTSAATENGASAFLKTVLSTCPGEAMLKVFNTQKWCKEETWPPGLSSGPHMPNLQPHHHLTPPINTMVLPRQKV